MHFSVTSVGFERIWLRENVPLLDIFYLMRCSELSVAIPSLSETSDQSPGPGLALS